MTDQKTFENIKKLLKKHNQSHLLAFWEQLNTSQRRNLLAQIRQLDFPKIADWVADFVKKPASAEISADFAPAQSYGPDPADAEQKRKYGKAVELGRELISAAQTDLRPLPPLVECPHSYASMPLSNAPRPANLLTCLIFFELQQ